MSLRIDGEVTFMFVQHQQNDGQWVESAVDHMLFQDLPYEDRRGAIGDSYRELMALQGANTPLWQRYGINGFVDLPDAFAMLFALRKRHPEMAFRLARRTIRQTTTEVEDLMPQDISQEPGPEVLWQRHLPEGLGPDRAHRTHALKDLGDGTIEQLMQLANELDHGDLVVTIARRPSLQRWPA